MAEVAAMGAMPTRASAVVIGAGIVGNSLVHHLALQGWKDIVLRTYQETQDDRLLALAAGVAFYALVALFPAIAAGVSFYALFADAGTIGKHLSLAAGIVPAEVLDLLRDEITRIAAKSDGLARSIAPRTTTTAPDPREVASRSRPPEARSRT